MLLKGLRKSLFIGLKGRILHLSRAARHFLSGSERSQSRPAPPGRFGDSAANLRAGREAEER